MWFLGQIATMFGLFLCFQIAYCSQRTLRNLLRNPAVSVLQVCLKIVFILINSVDPFEMLHYAAFHLGIYCLSKYLFTGIENANG